MYSVATKYICIEKNIEQTKPDQSNIFTKLIWYKRHTNMTKKDIYLLYWNKKQCVKQEKKLHKKKTQERNEVRTTNMKAKKE